MKAKGSKSNTYIQKKLELVTRAFYLPTAIPELSGAGSAEESGLLSTYESTPYHPLAFTVPHPDLSFRFRVLLIGLNHLIHITEGAATTDSIPRYA